MQSELAQPRTFLNTQSCYHCPSQPCNSLRFGGAQPGKVVLVHATAFGTDLGDCPFLATNSAELEHLLTASSIAELDSRIGDLLSSLSSSERQSVPHDHFVTDYTDVHGRITFLRTLWDNGFIRAVRIPRERILDPEIRRWLGAFEGLSLAQSDRKPQEAAVTDDMPQDTETSSAMDLVNPRWAHCDSAKTGHATAGEKVVLRVDVTGVPEGASVTFDVYDVSQNPPSLLETLKGTNSGGTAEVEWNVAASGSPSPRVQLRIDAPEGLTKEDSTVFELSPVPRGDGQSQRRGIEEASRKGDAYEISFDRPDGGGIFSLVCESQGESYTIVDTINLDSTEGAAPDTLQPAFEATVRSKRSSRVDISMRDRFPLVVKIPWDDATSAGTNTVFKISASDDSFTHRFVLGDCRHEGDTGEYTIADLDPSTQYSISLDQEGVSYALIEGISVEEQVEP